MYWRIFAWFLAANLATAAATVYVARPIYAAVTASDLGLDALAREAVDVFERSGRRALHDWLRRQARQRQLQLQLTDADGRPLLRLPSPALSDAGRPARPDAISAVIEGRHGQYRLQGRLLPGHHLRHGPWLRIAVSVVVLALVALLFSRWLSTPIVRLTQVTRRMAAGDLGARASPQIGPRPDEMGELAREFDRMAAQLQAGMDNQKRLLRDISHELRSPLARLEVALELARERGGPPAELDRIGLEAGRLNSLIDQILTLIRLESGGDLQRAPCDLNALLGRLADDARYAADGRVDILWQAGEALIAEVDSRLLASAVDNVLRNALCHAPDGSNIELALSRRGGQIEIRVRDQGPGVGEDQLERLFEPFFRASSARERSSGGHGVGLAIVAGVLRAHGGRASARNHPAGGLELRLCLPARP